MRSSLETANILIQHLQHLDPHFILKLIPESSDIGYSDKYLTCYILPLDVFLILILLIVIFLGFSFFPFP
jgi:hypothetical protein